MLLAAAMQCDFQESRGVLSCLQGRRGGAKLAVVVSSDVDHTREALDFIGSWSRAPPCSNSSRAAKEMEFDRQLLPALVLRLSCDWGYNVCDQASRALSNAVQPHMHCFSQLIVKLNIVMFRTADTGLTVADCFE
jgi:hypothetical protein